MTTPQNQNDIPTPRTNAVKRLYYSSCLNAESYEYVYADFARTLERENVKLKEELNRERDIPRDKDIPQMKVNIEFLVSENRDLQQQLAAVVEALRLLHDYQNGCPLPKYTKQWDRAMELAEKVLPQAEQLLNGGQ